MRIWDVQAEVLCRHHLLGEHRELHAIWSILTKRKKGYANHPETRRWQGKLKALYLRHNQLVAEMLKRGYRHHTPLPAALATGDHLQDEQIQTREQQIRILREKGCGCTL